MNLILSESVIKDSEQLGKLTIHGIKISDLK
jgi:hypothetical protein